MEPLHGTYALILRGQRRSSIQVGRWREIRVEPGYYLYVGSAFGPGGIRARINRHGRRTKTRHWHIDYLREVAVVLGAWISHEPVRLEHVWARALCSCEGVVEVPGFGCTDCNCLSHLFFSPDAPCFDLYTGILEGRIVEWNYENKV